MRRLSLLMAFALTLGLSTGTLAQGQPATREVILATTTSTYDTGLLDFLNPLFEQATGYQMKAISVGTGQALALGERAEADVLLVHAPSAERAWMEAGNGTRRVLVMYNDFVIVGPANDPAAARGRSAVDGLTRIAGLQATWVSRGDNSGTNILEKQLWRRAGIDPQSQGWYLAVGQGMGATLNVANDRQGYTLADRGTWLARQDTIQLPIVVEGDPALRNIYHVMPVNPSKSARINGPGGEAYADWLARPNVQALIAGFGVDRYGQPLFYPAAAMSEDQLTAP